MQPQTAWKLIFAGGRQRTQIRVFSIHPRCLILIPYILAFGTDGLEYGGGVSIRSGLSRGDYQKVDYHFVCENKGEIIPHAVSHQSIWKSHKEKGTVHRISS